MFPSRRSIPACCWDGLAASTCRTNGGSRINLTLNTGVRFDQMWQYQNANQLSPRVSLTYQPIETTTFHAGFARTFTPPVQVIAAPTNTALFTSCPCYPELHDGPGASRAAALRSLSAGAGEHL